MVRVVEEEPQAQKQLDILFFALKLPVPIDGKPVLFGGFNRDGTPVATVETGKLARSNAANAGKSPGDIYAENGRRPLPFPFSDAEASLTPNILSFKEMAQPVDNQDRRQEFVQDLVTISGVNERGSLSFIQIPELDLLNAILVGEMSWKFRGTTLHSLLIPDHELGQLHAMVFNPEGKSSNELAYRTFLLRVMDVLIKIDRAQNPPDQKGYNTLITAAAQKLREIYIASKQPIQGAEKIMLDLGFIANEDKTAQQLLQEMTLPQMRKVIEVFHTEVSKRFEAGR